MSFEQAQIADSLMRNELTKRLLANVDGSRIYAVSSEWEKAVLSKSADVVSNLPQFEKAFVTADDISILIATEAALSLDDLKTVIKANSQIKTIFVEV